MVSEAGETLAAAASTQSSSFRPAADARIRADSPDSNYGDDDELAVDGSPRQRVLLRFNVAGLPSNADVQSA